MKNLRLSLLNSVIETSGVFYNKYSNSFNALKGIIELEGKETINKLPSLFFDEFKSIEKAINNLDVRLPDVPLLIVEQYFFRNAKNLSKFVYIEWGLVKTDFKVIDLYLILETFFSRIYMLCIGIADYYNLDIKLKNERKERVDYI